MEKCLDEKKVAESEDFLCYDTGMLDAEVMNHVEGCLYCKQEVMNVCDLVDQVGPVFSASKRQSFISH